MKKILQYLVYCLVFINCKIIQMLPISIAYFFADILGYLLYWILPQRRSQIYENLKIAYPQGIPFSVAKFSREVFANMNRGIFDLIIAQKIFKADTWQKYVTGPGLELMKQKDFQKRGAIFCSGHIGSFYISSALMHYLDVPLVTVIRQITNPYLHKFFVGLLEYSGHKVMIRAQAYETYKQELPNGLSTSILIDQHAGHKALYVEFMGKKAYTAASVAALARQFQRPVYVAALFRCKNKFKFEFYLEQAHIPPLTENKQADLENITKNVNIILEKYIKMNPSQWFWMHRRWRE